jgi:hypothetical protein
LKSSPPRAAEGRRSFHLGRTAALRDLAPKLTSSLIEQIRAQLQDGRLATAVRVEKRRVEAAGIDGEEAEVALVLGMLVNQTRLIRLLVVSASLAAAREAALDET